jgi:hypothetical protein
VHLFFVQPISPEDRKNEEVETLSVRSFITAGCIPSPRLLPRKKIQHSKIGALKRVERDFVEIRL